MNEDSASLTSVRSPFQLCLLLRGCSHALLILTHFLRRSTGAETDTYSPAVKAVLANLSNAMARNSPNADDKRWLQNDSMWSELQRWINSTDALQYDIDESYKEQDWWTIGTMCSIVGAVAFPGCWGPQGETWISHLGWDDAPVRGKTNASRGAKPLSEEILREIGHSVLGFHLSS